MNVKNFLEETVENLDAKGLKRSLHRVDSPQGRKLVIDGRWLLNFCSNNYLGLADDPRLKEAAAASLKNEGFGAGASRLVCGNLASHYRLEEKIAAFKQTERAILFSTGYMANTGIIPALFGREDCIFCDRLNHASILDGVLLSRARMQRYPHRDMHALEKMLKESSRFRKRVIITDSVFSMDGDIAPLDTIVALAERYDCMIMVDEAHALGVLGEHGRGAVEFFGLQGRVDLQMGTLSKAVGSFGAYCVGSAGLVEFLINTARSFIYTTGMPPSVAAASLKGLEIIEDEPQLRQTLWSNADFLHRGLRSLGFDTLNSQTPIIPVCVRDAAAAVEFSRRLYEAGILVSAIRPPTVPHNTSRLRLTVMATHTREDLEFLLQQFGETGRELCLI